MNYDYIEFSKIYKRVMDVELRLKYQFKFAMQSAFPKNMFSRLIYYMQANLIGRYTDGIGKQKRDKIKDLIASKKSETEKLDKFINMAYLSDLINMLVVYPIIYKNKNFTKTFYTNKKVNFNDIKKFGGRLKKLRNIIMHFQIADYKLTTKDNFEALAYWEQILNCEKQGIHTLNISSLTTDNILKQLKSCLDYSKSNYREICDYYDDVALSNGVSTKNLSDYDEILKLLKLIKG